MNIKENFTCPNCNGRNIRLDSASPILSNVLLVNMTCADCGTQWRVYLQAEDVTTEVTYAPREEVPSQEDTSSEDVNDVTEA